MKKLLILSIILLLITACNNKEKQVIDKGYVDLDKPVRMATTKQFFDFNSVTYFHSDLTTTEWIEIAKKRDKKTQDEQNLSDLLIGKLSPLNLNDISYISKVEKLYHVKIEINEIQRFKDLFSKKYSGNFSSNACDPAYRDVLIFKQGDTVVGIARICLGCELFEILGSKQKTDGFGQMGDWKKLHILLGELLPKGSKLDF